MKVCLNFFSNNVWVEEEEGERREREGGGEVRRE